MKVKTQKNLVDAVAEAHSVVIEDDMGNPIFIATHVGEGIAYSMAGDPDFKSVLSLVGIDTAPTVREIPPLK
jgi:hypothetical protein